MGPRTEAGLGKAVPALPVRELAPAVAHYEERFGFGAVHRDEGFAVIVRDATELHLWEAGDTGWRERPGFAALPVQSGAESFLAGTASCRIETRDVDGLFAELQSAGVLHPAAGGEVTVTDFGTREFPTLDLDGNLLTFFRWVG